MENIADHVPLIQRWVNVLSTFSRRLTLGVQAVVVDGQGRVFLSAA